MEWNWWVLTFILPAWLLQNAVHEGSHALVATLRHRAKIVYFRALPTWVTSTGPVWWKPWKPFTRPTPDANFVWAYVWWDRNIARGPHSLLDFSPNLGATVVFSLATLAAILLPASWNVCAVPFLVCPVVDASVWWSGYFRNNPNADAYKWRHGLN